MSLHVLERPAAEEPARALVFFHGYAGVEEDFLPLLDELDPGRRLHGYLPRGQVAGPGDRFSWFEHERVGSAFSAGTPLTAWLAGIPFAPQQTVLAGWSQGAALALALGLSRG